MSDDKQLNSTPIQEAIIESVHRIEGKVDKLDDKLDVVSETLLRNTITVEIHERRSLDLESRIIPIEKHVQFINFTLKLLGIVAFIAGMALTFKELFN